MVLYFIGLGLGDETDITVKGLNAIRNSKKVYLENYTSILGISKEKLEAFYQKELIVAYRETVEVEMDNILEEISKDPTNDYSF